MWRVKLQTDLFIVSFEAVYLLLNHQSTFILMHHVKGAGRLNPETLSGHPACFRGLQYSTVFSVYLVLFWIKKKAMNRKEEYDSYEIEEPSDEERACSR